ncbi:hypothetical protein [Halorussus lipolyticus]|nr:hypothetical protein [Halorussus sp. DT80]
MTVLTKTVTVQISKHRSPSKATSTMMKKISNETDADLPEEDQLQDRGN